jgi:hypothetical protein
VSALELLRRRIVTLPLAILAVLLFIDLASTAYILGHGGIELNPLFGDATLWRIAFHHVAGIVIVGGLNYWLVDDRRMLNVGIWLMVVGYVAIVVFNLFTVATFLWTF